MKKSDSRLLAVMRSVEKRIVRTSLPCDHAGTAALPWVSPTGRGRRVGEVERAKRACLRGVEPGAKHVGDRPAVRRCHASPLVIDRVSMVKPVHKDFPG